MEIRFEGSAEELAALFTLIRSEPMTPEQVAELTAAVASQTTTSDAVKIALAQQ